MEPFDEGEQTLIRPDFEPGEDLEREEVERREEAWERPEVEPREEVLFREMSKSETKTHKWRKELSSLVKQSKNAMMSSICPSEEQTGSKAKKSRKSLYDDRMASLRTEGLSTSFDHPEITHPDEDFTPCPSIDMRRKALSTSPTRPMSDGITIGATSTFDKQVSTLNQVPTSDDLRMKSREYLLIKPRAQNRYNNYDNYNGTNTGANSSWYRPRDDMGKRRSIANWGSMDYHVSACSAHKKNMKAVGHFLDDVDN